VTCEKVSMSKQGTKLKKIGQGLNRPKFASFVFLSGKGEMGEGLYMICYSISCLSAFLGSLDNDKS
jgi:hypothetical protein